MLKDVGSDCHPVGPPPAALAHPVGRIAPRTLAAQRQQRLHTAAAQDLVVQGLVCHAEKMVQLFHCEAMLADRAMGADHGHGSFSLLFRYWHKTSALRTPEHTTFLSYCQ